MSWKKHKLGELLENFSVRAKEIEDYANLEFFGVSNEIGITESKYAAEDNPEEYKIIERGCFAYNPYRINVGSVALVNADQRGLISPAYVVFKAKPQSIVPELLLKFLKSSEGLREIKKHARGTVRQALRFEDLCKIEIELPDYDVQESLHKKLEFLFQNGQKIVNEQNNQLNILVKLQKQILQDAVQGKLVSQDPNDEPARKLLERIKEIKKKLVQHKKIKKGKSLPPINPEEIPFEIPENWVWCRLGEISFYSEAGKSYKASEINAKSGEFGVIKTSAITTSLFNENENKRLPIQKNLYDKILIKEGNLLFCRASGSKGLAGKSCVVLSKPKANLILSDKSIRYVLPDDIVTQYIHCFNSSSFAENYYMQLRTGKSTTMNNISREQFDELIIPLPPLPEQHRIILKKDHLMTRLDNLMLSIKQNQKYTQELLHVALKEALKPKNI